VEPPYHSIFGVKELKEEGRKKKRTRERRRKRR